jgi:hypothetical protein
LINARRHRWRLLRAGQACVTLWLGLAARPPAFAQSSPSPCEETPSAKKRPTTYGVEIALRSGHADRGFVINDRPVVQPVVWVTGRAGEASLWSSFPLAATTDRARPRIMELELTREHEWKNITIAPAITMVYYYDPVSIDTYRDLEGWMRLSYDAGPFHLFANQSVYLLTERGAYFGQAGITSERRVSHRVEVGGSFGAGWASAAFNDSYADVDKSALDRMSLEGWLTFHVTPHGYFGPHFEFSNIVDRRVRAELARPTYVFFGLTMGVEF